VDARIARVVVEEVPVSALFVVLRAGQDCPVRVYGPVAGSGLVPALSLGSGSDRVVLELPADAAGREVFLARLVDAASSLIAGEASTVA
jgi:hypothetical protein